MNKSNFWTVALILGVVGFIALNPDCAFAQTWGGGSFESKMTGLQSNLINKVLPILSTLGLIYAVFLSLTGDGGGKQKIIWVIVASIIGYVAPALLGFLRTSVGG